MFCGGVGDVIVKYRQDPQCTIGKGGDGILWHGLIAIDLRHVITAARYGYWTRVLIGGSSEWMHIDVKYEDFVRDWERARV